MDIEQAVAEFGNVEEVSGLPLAWRWSPMWRFVFSLAMDVDGRWAYQMNSIDVHDEGLARAVLTFARQHRLGRGSEARPLTVVPGFSYGTYRFDAVAAASPPVHENLEEAVLRVKSMLRPTVITRQPVPYLRMRYENTRTGGGSVGPSRGFTTLDVLEGELRLLEGAPGSFVEFENSRRDVWHVEWDGSWLVNGTPQEAPPSEEWTASALVCP